MNELRQVVKEAMVDGVGLNFAKQGSLYNKKYENKYGFAYYVIRRINELKSNSKNREDIEIASNIVCCLVSKGVVLYNIYSKFVIDELEEFAGHKDNMKNASICYNNQAKKFMEVAKGATSGKVKDAKMDNSILYLEYSENSRVQVAKITDGARKLGITQGEAGYGRNIIKIDKSEVEIITENGKRNYTNLEGSSGMAIIFPTSLGELQVNLYPQDKIRVEVTDKKKWEDLKSKKKGI
ncbi:MAG: hypothetical protein ACEY3A_05430 [Wolbachia sp.]